jgi:large subunit ribosomal protein L37Ae
MPALIEKKEKLGSQKRFGTRYGRKNRLKVARIEKEQRATHPCPYCKYKKVRRIALGIWGCKKCSSRFTGKAYTPNIQANKNE